MVWDTADIGEAGAGTTLDRAAELVRRLVTDIELARLAPGETMPLAALARRLRIRLQDLPPVIAPVVRRGLLTIDGDDCIIAPLDRDKLAPRLDRRLRLELQVVERAAKRVAPLDEAAVVSTSAFMSRCALLGDIEGFMEAGRRLDRLFFAAAGMEEEGAEITAIKVEFRRAWCARNRLRDLNESSQIRREISEAIIAGQPDVARERMEAFFNYLRRSY